MNIIKTVSGNVHLTDMSGNVIKALVNVNSLEIKSENEIIVKFGFNQWASIVVDKVANTQVEPAAAIPFSGNAYDLLTLLSADFFFELSGGGGSQDLASVLSIGNSTGFQDIDMSFGELKNTNLIDFNESISVTPTTAQLTFSNTYNTFIAGLGGNTIKLKIGTQEFAQVVNKTTPLVNLLAANYQVCIVAGATGQRLSVKLARADSDVNSAGTLGIVAENINGNAEGFIQTVGTIENLNTSGSLQGETWADGDLLYLSGTTFGAITNVKPSAPIHEVRVGYVEYAHATKGKIYVKIDNGYELDELHNVAINPLTIANKDILVYESATQLWKNEKQPVEIQLAASDETTALTTGTAKMTFRMPHAMTLTSVRASLTTAQTSGSIFTVDINQGGVSVLGTKLTIDNTEKTSTTAATPATITTSALTDDAEITIDIDQIGDGTAKGLKLTLIGTR